MFIKLTTDRATPGGYQPEGTILEVGDALGRRLLASGQAEAAEAPEPNPESARPVPVQPKQRKPK